MICINKETGEIQIGKLVLNPQTEISIVQKWPTDIRIEKIATEPDISIFRLLNIEYGSISVLLLFNLNRLKRVHIGAGEKCGFRPFELSEEEKNYIKRLLERLGGEAIYNWGQIQYSEDLKGGSVSVLIEYG